MITIKCLVDDQTKDSAAYQAEHGASFMVETEAGHILFDTGMSGNVLLHNANHMGCNLQQIDALVLSHAHYDHTGGVKRLMERSSPGLPLHAHLDTFTPRFAGREGDMHNIGWQIPSADLEHHYSIQLSTVPVEILPGIWTTGEVTPRYEFEGRSPNHFIQVGGLWQPDPYRDDISMVILGKVSLILICGCCHAGLLNTMAQVQRNFSRPITAIIGGTHLGQVDDRKLQHAIKVIRSTSGGRIPFLYLNHCSGERARANLAQKFGQKVRSFPAGSVLAFESGASL
jgi:7,8-dihydropterin-6-yl-methyl-4-(beta-D-ribofuranosyl)aminobenzene 5'-phosphate synthase